MADGEKRHDFCPRSLGLVSDLRRGVIPNMHSRPSRGKTFRSRHSQLKL